MALLGALHSGLINCLRALAGIVIFTIFLLIVSDVFMRLAGISPWHYGFVVVEYGLLWFTMLAAPWLARTKGHVFIDAITRLMPGRIQRFIEKFVYLVCIIACSTVAYFSLDLLITAIVENQIDTRSADIPQWLLLAPIPLAFSLVAIEFVRFFLGYDSMYGDRTDLKDNV